MDAGMYIWQYTMGFSKHSAKMKEWNISVEIYLSNSLAFDMKSISIILKELVKLQIADIFLVNLKEGGISCSYELISCEGVYCHFSSSEGRFSNRIHISLEFQNSILNYSYQRIIYIFKNLIWNAYTYPLSHCNTLVQQRNEC